MLVTKRKMVKKLISPMVGSIVAGLAVFAGFVVSIFSNDIRDSFPIYFSFDPANYNGISYPALLFWLTFIFFLLFTAVRQKFRDSEIILQRDNLVNTIQSLPPHNFAIKYRDEYNKINQLLNDLEILLDLCKKDEGGENNTDSDLSFFEENIRIILDAYVNLAQIWDTPDSLIEDNTVYRANIMFYYDMSEIPVAIEQNLLKMRNFFVEKNLSAIKSSIDGVLVLEDNKFTTTTASSDPVPDLDIKSLCMPVTFKDSTNKRMQNLPGAPKAVEKDKPQWILNTQDIAGICQNEGHFDGEVLEKIKKYYREDSKARSIISMPLKRVSSDDSHSLVGVINIYRNRKFLLRNEIRAMQFACFLEPFNSLLCRALSVYEEAYDVLEPKN